MKRGFLFFSVFILACCLSSQSTAIDEMRGADAHGQRFNNTMILRSGLQVTGIVRAGEKLNVWVGIYPYSNIIDLYGVMIIDGEPYSFDLKNISRLRRGIHPVAQNVPGSRTNYSFKLYSVQRVPEKWAGKTLKLVVGIVTPGKTPLSAIDCIPGYTAFGELSVLK